MGKMDKLRNLKGKLTTPQGDVNRTLMEMRHGDANDNRIEKNHERTHQQRI